MLSQPRRSSDRSDMSDTSRDIDVGMEPKPLAPLREPTYKRPFLSSLFTAILFFLCFIFLILVQTGNTAVTKHVGSVYFFKLDLSKVVPDSAPDAKRIMEIAHRLGVHDFYQVGLWNFCEGDVGPGLTFCGKPKSLYWFNPVEIFESELLNGAFDNGSSKSDFYLFIVSILISGKSNSLPSSSNTSRSFT